MCLANENFRNMAAFSEKLKIMNKFSFHVNFGVPPGFCEWGKKEKKQYILCTADTYHMYAVICLAMVMYKPVSVSLHPIEADNSPAGCGSSADSCFHCSTCYEPRGTGDAPVAQ